MKKTYITDPETSERCALYVGIDQLYGGWLLETSGDPTTLNELEDADCTDEIDAITAIITTPGTYWEPTTAEDAKYISGWLRTWGIEE